MKRSRAATLITVAMCILLAAAAGCASDAGTLDFCEAADAGAGCARQDAARDLVDLGVDSAVADAIADPDGSGSRNDATAADGRDEGTEDLAIDVGADSGPADLVADAGDAVDAVDPVDAAPDMTPPDASFNIRFATYNVRTSNLDNSAWGDTHVGFDSSDAARMGGVADTIASQNLTVVSMQEMRRPERDAVIDRLSNQHGQSWGATTLEQGADDTVVIFDRSVWRKGTETRFLIPLQPGLNDRNQIGVLLEHRATATQIWFYSIHLAAAGSAGESARRTGIQRTVASIKTNAVDNGQLFVLGGDCNTDSSGAVGDALRDSGFAKYTRNAADQKVNDGCNTFNGQAGSAGNQSCPGGAARHIDQVWVSKAGLIVSKYQVTANELTSRSSDHNPLTTILQKP